MTSQRQPTPDTHTLPTRRAAIQLRTQRARTLACITGALLALCLSSACNTTAAPGVERLGFLDDYSQLAEGRPGQASLIYIDGEVDFSLYSKMWIETVVAWAPPGAEPTPTTRELANHLDEDLRRELAREFELVDETREGAFRMRAALAAPTDTHVTLEVEILDATSGKRIVAAVDSRDIPKTDRTKQTDAWATLIRNRLASFRQFDAAARARAESEIAP